MAQVSCPQCRSLATKGGIPVWQIVVAILCFPVGLLAFLAGSKPTVCPECGFTWQA
jgi:hypothetical protein